MGTGVSKSGRAGRVLAAEEKQASCKCFPPAASQDRLTAHAIQFAPITAGLEHVARDDTGRERAMLGVDGRDLLRQRRELGQGRPDS